jgi:hypothetical protein
MKKLEKEWLSLLKQEWDKERNGDLKFGDVSVNLRNYIHPTQL